MPAYLACLAEFVFRCLQHTAKVKTDLTIAMNSLTFTLLKITTHRSWLRKTTLWQLFGKRRGNEIRCMLTIIELIKSARFRSRIHTWQGLACFITTTKLRSSWLVTRGSAVQEAGTCSLYFVVETAQQHWYVCSCKRSLLFRRSRYVEGTLNIKK